MSTSASLTTSASASKNGLSRICRSIAGLVTSAPTARACRRSALPVCFWICWRASLRRMPFPSMVTRLAPGLISSSALRRASRSFSMRSLRSPAGRVAESGRSGMIRGPSLVSAAIAASRVSGLSDPSRSRSWTTRSRKAASDASACARTRVLPTAGPAGAGHLRRSTNNHGHVVLIRVAFPGPCVRGADRSVVNQRASVRLPSRRDRRRGSGRASACQRSGPSAARSISASGLGIALAEGEVHRPADLLIEEDAAGESADARVEAQAQFAESSGAGSRSSIAIK